MRIDELMRSLLGRPLAVLVVVLVGVVGAAYGWSSASTTYESRAAVLIIPPAATDGGTGTNPLVNLDYGMSQLALTVSSQLQDDVVLDAVFAAGGNGVYTATTLSGDNAATAQLSPLVSLTAAGPSAEGAQAAAAALVEETSAQLAAIQQTAGVPATSQATAVTATAPTSGAAVGNAQLRAAGVTGLAAGLAALLALIAVTPLLDRRGRAGGPRPSRGVPKSAVRALLRDELERSGRNIPLTRSESREAWRRAEAQLERAQDADIVRKGGRQLESARRGPRSGRG